MTDIKLLDDKYDKKWTRLIFTICGLDYDLCGEEKITQELLEIHLNQIVQEIFDTLSDKEQLNTNLINYSGDLKYVDDILIGFQVLGIFILKTGARLPEIVKNAILFSTAWEYDRMRGWSKLFEEERKENLRKFRDAIMNHKEGKKIEITF